MIDLLPAALADVADPQVAGRAIEAEAPWVAQAVGVDLGQRASPGSRRSCRRAWRRAFRPARCPRRAAAACRAACRGAGRCPAGRRRCRRHPCRRRGSRRARRRGRRRCGSGRAGRCGAGARPGSGRPGRRRSRTAIFLDDRVAGRVRVVDEEAGRCSGSRGGRRGRAARARRRRGSCRSGRGMASPAASRPGEDADQAALFARRRAGRTRRAR